MFSLYIKWLVDNLDQLPALIQHAKEITRAESYGAAARELGEFLIEFGPLIDTLPIDPTASVMEVVEPQGSNYLMIEAQGFGFDDVMMIWQILQLIFKIRYGLTP